MYGTCFNGHWVRVARHWRGLTALQLANRMNHPNRQLILDWEEGRAEPDEHDLNSLVFILGFPPRFFYNENGTNEEYDELGRQLFGPDYVPSR